MKGTSSPGSKWIAPLAGIALLSAAGAWALGSGVLARAWLAIHVLDDLRRPGAESILDRRTLAPTVSPVTLAGPDGSFRADVYRAPRGFGEVPLIFVPGAVELGKEDPRVSPFARTLARAGYTVVIPDLPSMRSLKVLPENVSELATAHAAVCADRDLAPRGRAGLFGVSYAGGVALLAALDPATAPRVAYVATVGAHADLDTSIRYLATGRVFERGRLRQVSVDPYGRLVFVRTYQDFMRSDEDRRLLDAIIDRRIRDLDSDASDLVARLGPEGRLVVDLFEGRDSSRVPELIGRLPRDLLQRMHDLSPARRDFSVLKAPLYLVHARDDGTFPVTESERLARLARPHVRVLLVRLDALQHVEPKPWSSDPVGFLIRDIPEAVRLAAWWTAFLAER